MADKIIRHRSGKEFTVINNHFLKNPKLSWKAKGLLSYLMMLPENWNISISDLKNRSKDGRDGTAAGIRELIAEGYCKRTQIKGAGGIIEGYDYVLSDILLNGFVAPVVVEKKKPAKVEDDLFGFNDSRIKFFWNTPLFDIDTFLSIFEKEDGMEGIDLVVYYHKVKNWAEKKNNKRTVRGWKATVRDFIQSDHEKGKVIKLKVNEEQENLEYLKM